MFKTRNKRETGFEILRILAIYFIVIVHLLNAGGMLKNANENTVIWHKVLYSFFTPAVNVFVLVSAYFMVSTKLNYKRLLNLWCQVVFVSVTTYLILSLGIKKNFNFKSFVGCFFPVINRKYWFFSAYFILMLISPFLNKALNNSSKRELYGISVLLFVLSYLYMKHAMRSVFNLNTGYSVWWFICLYIFAGTVRLYPLNFKKKYFIIVYLISTIGLWLFSLTKSDNYWFNLIHNSLDYTSPLVVIASVSLLHIFKGINLKNIYLHNTICYISSLTFGIYLFEGGHLHEFWHFNLFKIQNYYTSPISPLWIMVVALEKFVFFAVIEGVRKGVVTIVRKLIVKKQQKLNNSLSRSDL